MSLFVASLNSGSNGNCYYLASQESAVIVDTGLSCRETEKRLKRLGRSLKSVKGVFITHEHGDHIHGLPGITRKFRIPVYISPGTIAESRMEIDRSLIHGIPSHEPITVGDIQVTAFLKSHDARDPHSFVVSRNGVRVGVFTDIGHACENVIHYFNQCHAVFLESNYDEDLLEQGSYPFHLKQRIKSDKGHLSNRQALDLFINHRAPYLSHLFLSHLSEDNNHPRLVQNFFAKDAGHTEIIVAGRKKETRLYHIRDVMPVKKKSTAPEEIKQLSLF
ncbi:MAG TPA: MBL fold metallo-hydrolase [Cyclobacteriaceae bacterium]|nr:MBL fold metallo-hydrolase [Cyclobacteriaceae bacterium]